MIKIILVGATGAMEETMAELFSKSSEYEIVAGITAVSYTHLTLPTICSV